MISRGIAAFLGAFTLLNLLGNLCAPGFDANLWWIDLSPLPTAVVAVVLLFGGLALLVFAFGSLRERRTQLVVAAPIALLTIIALGNVIRYYLVLHRHLIRTSVPIPFSAMVCAALACVAWRAFRPGARTDRPRHWRTAAVTAGACLIVFPLAQIYFFGHTDYRRKADAIVVFGARAYADGTPSSVLVDRVMTGCQLYHEGLAGTIIFSGGPGDGAIDEPQSMRRLALSQGVPDSAIRLDPDGLNTDATVRDTLILFQQQHIRRVLAVSHFYHLPRIKMAYRQAGVDVYTVPAVEHHRLPGDGRFLIVRELAALWAYYLHPLRK